MWKFIRETNVDTSFNSPKHYHSSATLKSPLNAFLRLFLAKRRIFSKKEPPIFKLRKIYYSWVTTSFFSLRSLALSIQGVKLKQYQKLGIKVGIMQFDFKNY